MDVSGVSEFIIFSIGYSIQYSVYRVTLHSGSMPLGAPGGVGTGDGTRSTRTCTCTCTCNMYMLYMYRVVGYSEYSARRFGGIYNLSGNR